VRDFIAEIPSLPFEVKGHSLGPYLAHPPRRVVPSQDGKALLVPVLIDGTKAAETIESSSPLFEAERALRVSAAGRLASQGLVVHVTGLGGVLADFVTAFGGIDAATDCSLLLVFRFREELHEHPSEWVAMAVAWRAVVAPIAASAVTVILGLLCLMLSQLGSTRGLGPIGALGIVGALVASLTGEHRRRIWVLTLVRCSPARPSSRR